MTEVVIEAADLRRVLRAYPTGVSAITAMNAAGQPEGMVIGTFMSVSLAPPLDGFLSDSSSSTWPQIEAAGHSYFNVLGSDQQALCARLAGRGDKLAAPR